MPHFTVRLIKLEGFCVTDWKIGFLIFYLLDNRCYMMDIVVVICHRFWQSFGLHTPFTSTVPPSPCPQRLSLPNWLWLTLTIWTAQGAWEKSVCSSGIVNSIDHGVLKFREYSCNILFQHVDINQNSLKLPRGIPSQRNHWENAQWRLIGMVLNNVRAKAGQWVISFLLPRHLLQLAPCFEMELGREWHIGIQFVPTNCCTLEDAKS